MRLQGFSDLADDISVYVPYETDRWTNPRFPTSSDQKAMLIKFKNSLTFDSSLSTKLVRWDQNTDWCL
ncbi:hypothetical protein RND71_003770 [Anisodus tanguticus]|uniref:Uncharacterized protein n=1 Tax=Anisodus tanguticus TaxID=243964 RepID=A0AAE1SV71_9SOLA|nr:hypothetical protein RND71_003770 [Anisodus tanguticus]